MARSRYKKIPNEDISPLDPSEKLNKAKKRNFLAFLSVSIPEILNFCVIFCMHFSKAFLEFLFNTPMRFVVFPFAAIYGLIKIGLAWNGFRLLGKDKTATKEAKRISLLQAIWETLNNLGTTGAVITGIVGFFIGASVGAGISITFNFFLAASTAICAAYTVYYAYTAHRAYKEWQQAKTAWKKENPNVTETSKEYIEFKNNHPAYKEFKARKEKAIDNAMITGFVSLLTVGVAVAMVAGILTGGAVIGVIGCLAGAAFSAYTIHKMLKKRKEDKKPDVNNNEEQNTNFKLHTKMTRSKSLSDINIQVESPSPINSANEPKPAPTSKEKPTLRRTQSCNDLNSAKRNAMKKGDHTILFKAPNTSTRNSAAPKTANVTFNK